MDRIDRYDIHHRIGGGAMGELLLATERLADGTLAPVAIKRILPEAASDPKLVKMLIDEGRVTRGLAHPGIARTLRTVEQDKQFYLVMEFVDGTDVKSLIRKLREMGKRLPAALGAFVAMRAADALDFAHRATSEDGTWLQIVHRDINPTNLMISYAGEVRVIDFGIARAADRLTATRAGVVKGKLRYMAPEQASGTQLDQRTDIYALGLVLYELLSGTRPLSNLSDMEFIHVALRGELPRLRDLKIGLPDELDAIVARATMREQDDRYTWGSEMATDLENWLLTLPKQPSEAELGGVMRRLFPQEAERMPQFLASLG
ncbi:MAG: serine/threonine protein kinase [Deltaproteobacteria bacterium]|nr:serine/threonine protein kinase [Deltaproteobacteria bacterium]